MSRTPIAPDFNPVTLLAKVVAGEDLSAEEAAAAFGHVVSGDASPIGTGALLAALQTKGLAPSEVAGGVRALRGAMIPVEAEDRGALVDTCGTGGGEVSTFNISTAAALVVAAGGVRVAKHGNRSFTSKCGSADVLEALGVDVSLEPAGVEAAIAEAGIGFLFAPALHGAMRHAIGPRRDIGVRTIFNILGPLTNPAHARHQLVGVYDSKLTPVLATVLNNLGAERVFVVHGSDGLDEVTTTGATTVSELRGGRVHTYKVHPEDFGLVRARPTDLQGGDAAYNAGLVKRILGGEASPQRDIVLLNAAAAIAASTADQGIADCLPRARESLESGRALAKLEQLREFTQQWSPTS